MTFFSLTDAVNSEHRRVDQTGVYWDGCSNLPFGDALKCWGPQNPVGPLHFTGQERDTESNLDHFWARHYSSQYGRWMSPDPAGMAAVDPSNPQSWNRYAYVMNNPMNMVDILGLVGCKENDEKCEKLHQNDDIAFKGFFFLETCGTLENMAAPVGYRGKSGERGQLTLFRSLAAGNLFSYLTTKPQIVIRNWMGRFGARMGPAT